MTILEAAKPAFITPAELQSRVNALTDADLLRLKAIARKYVGGHELAADDLVQEAICRVLGGDRKTCPVSLSIINYLAGTMKSIAFDAREDAKPLVHYAKDSSWEKHEDTDITQEASLLKAEADRSYYKALEDFFEGDDEAILLLLYLQDHYTPAKIREAENWSKTQYDTIRKRIRRKLNEYGEGAKI